MKALIVSADGFEDSELQVPYQQLTQEDIATDVASLQRGMFQGKHGAVVEASLTVEEVDPGAYDLLILPGGRAPAQLRKEKAVLDLVRRFVEADKLVAAICHGPQILISAQLMEGRKATCYRSVATEMKQAGAYYVDEEVVVDGNLITSRQPSDLPAFMEKIIKSLHSR
ncbi:intracellular protease, PfpI family [Nitrosococcus halophilus Nc 4]|uniref:Intracellular protease, PfpI family n=1 Tax=Nitrosococcus halophilus (strain Nc4) TaxID=472759 RepID=D5BZN9_NITHN|nr:type 1 glutamine amidotransferase domain-containing protein [Nitrosococcus halophilus]ADE14334.1 intracellular protease, PfpI family [Nitrosococcus halophilus Nc 4]